MENQIVYLDITSIGVNPKNPRRTFDPVALGELSRSIKVKGVIQPIIVRRTPADAEDQSAEYQLVCGERRWRASAMAGVKTIPAVVRDLTDDEAVDVAITENLQRKDVSPIEEADAFGYLLDKGQSVADLCARFGKSEFYVRGRLKLLTMSDDFRKLLDAGEISISQAMEIVKFDGDVQKRMYADHFQPNVWNPWRELNAKTIYQRGVQHYTKELSHYKFDKTECDACPNCTKNSCLFSSVEEASCQDSACLERKELEYKISLVAKLQNQHPEADLIIWNKDSKIKTELEAQGYEVKISQGYVSRVGAVITKDLKKKIEEGAVVLVISVQDDPYLGYISATSTIVGSAGDTLKTLRDKDNRNAELAEEKTVSDVRDAIKGMDAETLSSGKLTAYESQLALFVMVRNLKREQQQTLGEVKGYSMSDEEAWDIVVNASAEQIAYIHRCCILNQVGDHFRKDFKTELFFDWVNSRDKTIVPEIELKHKETYLRRKEKIEARIAEIELAKEEK